MFFTATMIPAGKTAFNRVFRNPRQIRKRHHNIVAIFGRLGFFTKAFIYATIGGLTVESALSNILQNEAPQGVFILLGSVATGAGHVLLICMLAGIAFYATWRFWEGFSGQGYDPNFSKQKNFFRYRLSPIASGGIYTAYGAYIIYLFTLKPLTGVIGGSSMINRGQTCFPSCWRTSVIGTVGLCVLGLAFSIATITQLIPALGGNFRKEMDYTKFNRRFVKYLFFVAGHLGFVARSVLFFLVAFLFWKIVISGPIRLDPQQSTVGQAINVIRGHLWGRVVMTLLGIGLILYGCFALLCTYFKIFPTPPPSQNRTLPSNSNSMPMTIVMTANRPQDIVSPNK